jgi:hypothetical protein
MNPAVALLMSEFTALQTRQRPRRGLSLRIAMLAQQPLPTDPEPTPTEVMIYHVPPDMPVPSPWRDTAPLPLKEDRVDGGIRQVDR